jgi:polysaccharide biosynthesis/export protein
MRFQSFSDRLNINIMAIILMFVSLVLLPAAAIGESPDTTPGKSSLVPVQAPYIIQPNDVLEIFVWKEPDLTRKVLVRPDGRISLPLVQDLQAAGIGPSELKQRIETQLREYLSKPNVTVVVDQIRSYTVYVVGKVLKPGSISVETPITVLQALTLAGGFQDFAKDSDISVVRMTKGKSSVYPFNYKDVTRGKTPQQNIMLLSSDVVVVP